MSFIVRNDQGLWAVRSGKHAGLSLEEIAQRDPGYLTWVWNMHGIYDQLEDGAAFALDDVMTKYGVSFEQARRTTPASS
jgi:hypothetical protein